MDRFFFTKDVCLKLFCFRFYTQRAGVGGSWVFLANPTKTGSNSSGETVWHKDHISYHLQRLEIPSGNSLNIYVYAKILIPNKLEDPAVVLSVVLKRSDFLQSNRPTIKPPRDSCVGELSPKVTSGHQLRLLQVTELQRWPLSGQESSAQSFRVHSFTRFDLKSILRLNLFKKHICCLLVLIHKTESWSHLI